MLPPNLRDYHLEIRCPRCGGRARWEEPFQFVRRHDVPEEEWDRLVAWGQRWVREKFPSLVRWKPLGRGHGWRHATLGVFRCGACHAVALHRLRWPADAFFQWRVRGMLLFAWDEAHARVLLHYVGATLRDPDRYGERYRKSLQRLPAEVIGGHARGRVVARIAETLRANGIPPEPPRPAPRDR